MSDSVRVRCSSCGFAWSRSDGASFYERQSLESRPCPRCAACTLCVEGPKSVKLPRRILLQEQRRERVA